MASAARSEKPEISAKPNPDKPPTTPPKMITANIASTIASVSAQPADNPVTLAHYTPTSRMVSVKYC